MVKSKKVRQKGKLKLSEYYKELNNGDRVAVVAEKSVRKGFPSKIQGCTGEVVESRGSHKLVKLKDKNATKTFIIHPIHLRRIKNDN